MSSIEITVYVDEDTRIEVSREISGEKTTIENHAGEEVAKLGGISPEDVKTAANAAAAAVEVLR